MFALKSNLRSPLYNYHTHSLSHLLDKIGRCHVMFVALDFTFLDVT
jgi:hypothetical protein